MIEKKLSYTFKNKDLLDTALTHSSYANEYGVESNERLEFLGDAILGCIVARVLYDKFPEYPEGELSKMRSAIVSRTNFARYARQLRIDKQILLGKGEEHTGGRDRESNLASTFEAVIGAIYIDGGYRKTYSIVSRLTKESLRSGDMFSDHKTKFQEVAQKKFKQVPRYRIISEEGPPHEKTFHVEVKLGSRCYGVGMGKSKKEAEQVAAEEALKSIDIQV